MDGSKLTPSNLVREGRNSPLVVLGSIILLLMLGDIVLDVATGQLEFSNLVVLLWRGLVNGLTYGLAGIGLSMTYSILNFANFSHGDYLTVGAFGGWSATWVIAGLGVTSGALLELAAQPFGDLVLIGAAGDVYAPEIGANVVTDPLSIIIGLVIAAALTIAVALLIDKFVYSDMREDSGIVRLIASIGVAFALRYLIVFFYTQQPRSVTESPGAFKIAMGAGSVNFSYHQITLVVVAVATMLAVHFTMQRTKLGKAMRAMSDNEDLARVTGIPTEQVITWTWIIGAGLAGMAGYLAVLEAGTIAFNRGWLLLLFVFAAVILGGIGSIYGAIYGGLLIGLTDSLSQIWLPSGLTQAAAFGIMILVLLYRPQGLFAGRTTA